MAEHGAKGFEPPNELVRWLRLLSLPPWARVFVSFLLLAVMLSALALVVQAFLTHEIESASSALGLLTVALPILVIVVALVFGQNSDQQLRKLADKMLRTEIVDALHENFGDKLGVSARPTVQGCCADYHVQAPGATLDVSVELNVYKVNVCFWLDKDLPSGLAVDSAALAPYRHVIAGAIAEGYTLNDAPAQFRSAGPASGALFFRRMPEDFLLMPAQRLYFVQDLSFFIRGMLEARMNVLREAGAT